MNTLYRELVLPIITEVARDVLRSYGFRNNTEYIQDTTENEKAEVQMEILRQQTKRENQEPNGFISDRSVFDAVAYAKAYGVSSAILNQMYYNAWREARKYTLLIYIPPTIPLVGDGFRDEDLNLRIEVDQYLKEMIPYNTTYNPRTVHTLTSDTPEERIEEVRLLLEIGA